MCFQQNRLPLPTADALRSNGEADNGSEIDVQALIGANLKRLRKQRGLTRRRLAYLAQVESSTVRELERGATTPSIGMLWRLARELAVPCTAFIEAGPSRAIFETARGRAAWRALGEAIGSPWLPSRRHPRAEAVR